MTDNPRMYNEYGTYDYGSYYSSYNPSVDGMPVAPDNSDDAFVNYLGYTNSWFPWLHTGGGKQQRWADQNTAYYNAMMQQYENWYNSEAATMARRSESGINPFYNNGSVDSSITNRNATSPNIAASGAQDLSAKVNLGSSLMNSLFQLIQLRQLNANVEKTQAETDVLNETKPFTVQNANQQFHSSWLTNFRNYVETFGNNAGDFGGSSLAPISYSTHYLDKDYLTPLSKVTYEQSPWLYNLFKQSKQVDLGTDILSLQKTINTLDSQKAEYIMQNFKKLFEEPSLKEAETHMASLESALKQAGMSGSSVGSVLTFISNLIGFKAGVSVGVKK